MKCTTNFNYVKLAATVTQWNEDRLYFVKEYNKEIGNLAKHNYNIDMAKMFLAQYEADPDATISKYGRQQAAMMKKNAIKTIQMSKNERSSVYVRIVDLKRAVKRNTILALKLKRAKNWANEILNEQLIDHNPALKRESFKTNREWRDAVNTVKSSVNIKMEWDECPENPANKQFVSLTMDIKDGVFKKMF